MKKFVFLFILCQVFIHARDYTQWQYPELNDLQIELNPVELRNRSSCAIDSKLPTKSIFLFINNSITAKGAYRLANRTNQDTTLITKQSIKAVRNKATKLAQRIYQRLAAEQIPLLPHLDSKSSIPINFKKIMQMCAKQRECPQLDEYIEKIWKRKSTSDHYDRTNYIDERKVPTEFMKCFKIEKFGPLQANLFGQKPTHKDLNKIAAQLSSIEESISPCKIDDIEDIKNLKVSGFQFDIQGVSKRYWDKKVGHDFWNSFKLYFSWGMRNLSVVEEKYERIIMNSNTQDYILLVPNGCKSITPATCNNRRLSENSFREFHRQGFEKTAFELDILSPISEGVHKDILARPFTPINRDILDIASHDDADGWIDNMFSNQIRTKNYIKNKLIESITFFSLTRAHLTTTTIRSSLESYYSNLENDIKKNDLYYLCGETSIISDDIFSFLRKHLEGIRDTDFIDKLNLIFQEQPLSIIIDYYTTIMKETRAFCKSLNQKDIFNNDFVLNKKGFNQWYLEKVYSDTKTKSEYLDTIKSPELEQDYLTYKDTGNVICHSVSHCLRQSILNILELSRATYYGHLFWKSKKKTADTDLFNPYSERTACKVYDPYFKTKSVMTRFVSDIGQAMMSFFTPGVVYTKVNLQPGYVTSFNKMIENGEIHYNKEYSKQKVNVELITEFGPLIGVPCMVSITGGNTKATNLYHFRGISVGACVDRQNGDIIANSGSDITNNSKDGLSSCFACRLNFEGISNSLSFLSSKLGPVFYIARALYSVYQGFKDLDNIPRRWTLNLNHLKHTYQRFGEIPKRCKKRLLDGKLCMGTHEESMAFNEIIKNNYTPLASKKILNGYKYIVKECRNELKVSTLNNSNRLVSNCDQ